MRPWSFGQKKKHRLVYFYDVECDGIASSEVEKIFSQEGMNSQPIEAFLNKYIENPISQYRQRMVEEKHFRFDDVKLVVALRLFLAIQILRYVKAKKHAADMHLEELVDLLTREDEKALNQWATASDGKTFMAVLHLMPHDFLYYPESGFFAFPAPKKEGRIDLEVGWAFPISPRTLVARLPIDIDMANLRRMPLSAYSTSDIASCNKYIIPPYVYENSKENLIPEFKRIRQVSEDAFTSTRLLVELLEFQRKSIFLIPHKAEYQEWLRINEPIMAAIEQRKIAFEQSDWGKRVAKMVAERDAVPGELKEES